MMYKNIDQMLENKSQSELADLMVQISKMVLNSKKHIKKYNKLRNLHSEIIDSMLSYAENNKYDLSSYLNEVNDEKNKFDYEIKLCSNNPDDITVLTDLYVYKNHKDIPSITEIYLEKNKYRNKEKVKMLESMNNSYVGLFKIIGVDSENGYVTYEDVFSKRKFKIVDIALSSTLAIDKKKYIYTYNRIITYEDISFATGIHCYFYGTNKELLKFIKKYKIKKCSDFVRCISLYKISKKYNDLSISYNNQFSNR